IIEACQEGELASEYRHGNESYGAFTFGLAKTLRAARGINFCDLVTDTDQTLKALGFEQTPQLLGPAKVIAAQVPWQGAGRGSRAQPRKTGVVRRKAVRKNK
ncbi:MAG: hypothetical protein H7Y02_12540, partial [Candidatus Obscuribacterales bacterium]|nr:hypothetical protein [Steroidobacteraceae bacterium]